MIGRANTEYVGTKGPTTPAVCQLFCNLYVEVLHLFLVKMVVVSEVLDIDFVYSIIFVLVFDHVDFKRSSLLSSERFVLKFNCAACLVS